jgi:hypothetical protein
MILSVFLPDKTLIVCFLSRNLPVFPVWAALLLPGRLGAIAHLRSTLLCGFETICCGGGSA